MKKIYTSKTAHKLTKILIHSTDAANYGAIVCKSEKDNTYYPISFFASDDGLCLLNNLTQLEILKPDHRDIQTILGKSYFIPFLYRIDRNEFI